MFELGNAYKNQLIDNYAENKYYTTDDKIDIKDKNNTKSIILRHVDEKSVCLDVGCGVGYLGGLLHKHKKVKVYGVDIDAKALSYAKKSGDFVDLYHFSITERKGEDYKRFIDGKMKFDYIIFADVLEHVTDPEDLLMFFVDFLKPEGKILISLPNVAHFDIVKGLIDGKFNYNHIGILDNTHYRFYTKNSFKEFLQQVNDVRGTKFAIKEIGKTVVEPDYIKKYPNFYELLNRDGEACVLQYVYEISIDKKKKGITIKEKKSVFDEMEEALAQAKREKEKVAELEEAIKALRSSTSWKITKPIRKVSGVIKGTKEA